MLPTSKFLLLAAGQSHNSPIGIAMPKSEYESSLRPLKVDVPADLRIAIKHEAVSLDVPLRTYLRQVLEDRLPIDARKKLAEKAKAANLDVRDYVLQVLRQAGALD